MSLATLKKKTEHKYKNNSVSQSQFSLNGTTRNQGYIGQTSLSRTIIKTPMKGISVRGHGGCCGSYDENVVCPSGIKSLESNEVKKSVLSTKGMLQSRLRWVRRPEPFSVVKKMDGISDSSDRTNYKKRKELKTIKEINESGVCLDNRHCCSIKVNNTKMFSKESKEINHVKKDDNSYESYLNSRKNECINNDKIFERNHCASSNICG
jgi:hypothetical protein